MIKAVKAESSKTNISSSVNAATTDENLLTEYKGSAPVQHCPLPSAELTTHQPQVRNVPLQPNGPPSEQLADSVPPCHSQPDCPCFDVNESLSLEQRRSPFSKVPRIMALRVMRQAAGLPPEHRWKKLCNAVTM